MAGRVKWSATCSKLSGVLVQGGLVLASKIFFPENASWLDGRIATFYPRQLILVIWQTHFPYDFETKGMLLTAKSFCFFWDKYLGIAPKKFHHFISKNETIRTV